MGGNPRISKVIKEQQGPTQRLLLPSEELPQSKHQQEQDFLSHLYFHVVPLEQSSRARTAPDGQLARNSHFKASSIKLSLSLDVIVNLIPIFGV